jgi:ATP-dependent DNA helicase HFM1/MER3
VKAYPLTRVDRSSVGSSSVFDVVSVHAEQMRADREGVAIIMCESGLENKYRALGQSQTTLESSLHTNLAEHLNSEIGLGTIKNMETAKEWIRHSFMFRRLAQNPHRYMPNEQTWQGGLDGMISKCFDDLKNAELLTYVDERSKELRSTEFGEIMSKVRSLKIERSTSAHRSLIVLH